MKKFNQNVIEDYMYDERLLNSPNYPKTFYNNKKFCYVNVLIKGEHASELQSFGPYNRKAADSLMLEYLKKGHCCWIEESHTKK